MAENIDDEEMLQVFNMGFGMLIFVNEMYKNRLLFMNPSYKYLGTVIEGDDPKIKIV